MPFGAYPDPEAADEAGPEETGAWQEPKSDLWCYRVRRFRELGFTRPQRIRLADEAADWHQAHDLIGRGCPVDVVFDLLSS